MTHTFPQNTKDWTARDTAHHVHPFTDHRELHHQGGARPIVSARGVWLEDGAGRQILDALSGLWCVNVGYGRHRISKAVAEQMDLLPYYNTFFKTTTPPVVALAETLSGLLPKGFSKLFFSNSGSEANETMIRFIRHYWALKKKPYRRHIISRWRAYHGSTLATAAMGGMTAMHTQDGPGLPGFHHILPPHWYDNGGDLSPEAFGLKAAQALEEKILALGPDNVAAFVGEPIQGAGGVIIPPRSYWPEVERICRKYGVLLVSDEVICGFGRTGAFWGCETFSFTPDVIVMAKGLSSGYLPIGATAFSDALCADLFALGGEFFHGYTYSGHPAACVAALENIAILKEESLVERVRSFSRTIEEALAPFADHPLVGEVRLQGFIGALELVRDKASRTRFSDLGKVGTVCRNFCFENDLIMRACWDTMVFAPPFVLSAQELEEWMRRLHKSLDQTWQTVRSWT